MRQVVLKYIHSELHPRLYGSLEQPPNTDYRGWAAVSYYGSSRLLKQRCYGHPSPVP